MKQSTRVMLNSVFLLLQQVINMGVQVFLLAFILRKVTEEEYGLFLLAVGAESLLFLLAESIKKGCVVQAARAIEQKDTDAVNRMMSSAVAMLAVSALLAATVLVGGAHFLARWLDISPVLQTTMTWLWVLIGVDLLVVLPGAPYGGLCMANQRYDVITLSSIATRVSRLGLVVLALTVFEPSLVWVMVAFVLSNAVGRIIVTIGAYRLTPGLRIRPALVRKGAMAALLGFGLYLVLGNVASVGAIETTKWIVGMQIDPRYVTYLSISIYITTVLTMLVLTMTTTLVPVASKFKAQGKVSILGDMLVRSSRYASIVSMGGAAILLPAAGPLFALWLKPGLAWLAPYALAVGICGGLFLPCSSIMQILNGMGDAKRPFWALLIRGVATITTTVLFVVVLQWGFIGAIVGMCVGQVAYWAALVFYGLRSIPVKYVRLAWHGYGQPLLAATVAFATGWLLTSTIQPDTWLKLGAVWSGSAVVFIAIFLPFVSNDEWQLARSFGNRLRILKRGPDIVVGSPEEAGDA